MVITRLLYQSKYIKCLVLKQGETLLYVMQYVLYMCHLVLNIPAWLLPPDLFTPSYLLIVSVEHKNDKDANTV